MKFAFSLSMPQEPELTEEYMAWSAELDLMDPFFSPVKQLQAHADRCPDPGMRRWLEAFIWGRVENEEHLETA